MYEQDLFDLIKETLAEQGISEVVTYVTAEQTYPYVYVEIYNWEGDHPQKPRTARADVKITIKSKYQGKKELTQLRQTMIHALEKTTSLSFSKESLSMEKESPIREITLYFKAILRG